VFSSPKEYTRSKVLWESMGMIFRWLVVTRLANCSVRKVKTG
jgi:hypothetical protein